MGRRRRRLLALSTYPREDASVRQRFLAYVPSLERAGWTVRFETIVTRELFLRKNRVGIASVAGNTASLAAGLMRRLAVLLTAGTYDAVWIHREAFPFFTPWVERLVRRMTRGPIIFDFDDALYVPPPGGRDWRSAFRSAAHFRDAVDVADHVFSGSPTLRDWTREQGIDSLLIPTCVDTARLRPTPREPLPIVTIGWIGSWSTARYLLDIAAVLTRVAMRPDVAVTFVGAANLAAIQAAVPGSQAELWTLDREANQLSHFDIGIMPVPDTPWERGKCAYKLIQYMAIGIPFVASPVGMNVNVTTESSGGLLCDSPDEWEHALTQLVENTRLRQELGAAGRAHAVARYDHALYAPQILAALEG